MKWNPCRAAFDVGLLVFLIPAPAPAHGAGVWMPGWDFAHWPRTHPKLENQNPHFTGYHCFLKHWLFKHTVKILQTATVKKKKTKKTRTHARTHTCTHTHSPNNTHPPKLFLQENYHSDKKKQFSVLAWTPPSTCWAASLQGCSKAYRKTWNSACLFFPLCHLFLKQGLN